MADKITFRSGTSYARGTTIDIYLSAEEIKKLYEKWNKTWEEPLSLQGGESAITCEMVRNIPLDGLTKAFGKTMAARLFQIAAENTDSSL